MSPIFDDLLTECTSIVHPIPIIPSTTTYFAPLFSPRYCPRTSFPLLTDQTTSAPEDHIILPAVQDSIVSNHQISCNKIIPVAAGALFR